MVSGLDDNTLKIWDIESGKCLRTLKGNTTSVLAVGVTLDGRTVVCGSADKTLRVWDIESGEVLASFTADDDVNSCAVALHGRAVVVGDGGGHVHFLKFEGLLATKDISVATRDKRQKPRSVK